MKSRYKYLVIIVLCGFFAPFCVSDDDNCGLTGPSYIDIEGMELASLLHASSSLSKGLSSDTTIRNFQRTEDVLLEINYVVSYLSSGDSQPSILSQFLSPQLFACSIFHGGDGSKEERHAGVTVTTVFDHSPGYPAGSELNDTVLAGEVPYVGAPLGNVNSPLDSLVRDTSLIQGFGLALSVPSPEISDTMQLKIELNLDTGEAYELLTPKLVYTQ